MGAISNKMSFAYSIKLMNR